MTTLRDILDEGELELALQAGHVRQQHHPDYPLGSLDIFNYTEKAQYENAWTPVTTTCRGLIICGATGKVLARPFAKFFNHGQPGAAHIALDEPVHVTDKLDGSLGILYPTPDGQWAIATRGSFASEQAIHATELLRTRYPHFTPPDDFTVLFEIIYPANRIVCDYGNLDDLVLLGAVGINDGLVCGPAAVPSWTGPVAQTFTAATFADALALPPRTNAEGIVVRSLGTGRMVKIKQDDYVALHRIVTGLNARSVWQHLCDAKPIANMLDGLPDEFHTWVLQVAEDITSLVDQQEAEAEKAFAEITASLPAGFARRDFATQAVAHPLKWALFLLLDGRDIRPQLLRNAKPDPYLTPSGRVHSEDVA